MDHYVSTATNKLHETFILQASIKLEKRFIFKLDLYFYITISAQMVHIPWRPSVNCGTRTRSYTRISRTPHTPPPKIKDSFLSLYFLTLSLCPLALHLVCNVQISNGVLLMPSSSRQVVKILVKKKNNFKKGGVPR